MVSHVTCLHLRQGNPHEFISLLVFSLSWTSTCFITQPTALCPFSRKEADVAVVDLSWLFLCVLCVSHWNSHSLFASWSLFSPGTRHRGGGGGGHGRETVWRTGHSNKHSVLIVKTEASWRSLLRMCRGREGAAWPCLSSFQRKMSQKEDRFGKKGTCTHRHARHIIPHKTPNEIFTTTSQPHESSAD